MTNDNRSVIPSPIYKIVRGILRRISIRRNVTTGTNFRAGLGSIISAPHGLRLGNSVAVGPMSVIQCDGTIGDYAMIGMGVHIVGREDHSMDELGVPMLEATWAGSREQRQSDHIQIGKDVWVGANSVILSGIQIGDGAVVGAGSVVTSDVPAFAIVVGNPARVVKMRFNNDADRMKHLSLINSRTH